MESVAESSRSGKGKDKEGEPADRSGGGGSESYHYSLRAIRADDIGVPKANYTATPLRSRLIFPDVSDVGIGVILAPAEGRYVTSRIFFEELQNWSSDILFEIKAHVLTPGLTPAAARRHDLAHVWTFRLHHSNNSEMHLADFSREVEDPTSPQEVAFSRYCQDDPGALKLRNKGFLSFVAFKFEPAVCPVQGILIEDTTAPADFQDTHRTLSEVFNSALNTAVQMVIFYAKSDTMSFGHQYEQLVEHNNAREDGYLGLWFNQTGDRQPRIQLGQITPLEERPTINLPYRSIYTSYDECWTIEGLSVIQGLENTKGQGDAAASGDCELRVLQTSAGGDREYLALLRVPDGFSYRPSPEDQLIIIFPGHGEEEWDASVLAHPFIYSNTTDISLSLRRPVGEDGFSTLVLNPVFDLQTLTAGDERSLEEFCHRSEGIMVGVAPSYSEKPAKFTISAIRIMNPVHMNDRGHRPNLRFNDIILGQDLRTQTRTDIFKDLDVDGTLARWMIHLNTSQRRAIAYLQALPDGFGLIKGPWGTGKTYVDVVVTLLLLCQGQRVKVLSPSNETADSFVLQLKEAVERLAKRGTNIAPGSIVRVHALATEQNVITAANEENLPESAQAAARRRWTHTAPNPTMIYDRAAYDIIDAGKIRNHGVRDRRYRLHESSLSNSILQVTRVNDRRPSHNEGPSSQVSNTTIPTTTVQGFPELRPDEHPQAMAARITQERLGALKSDVTQGSSVRERLVNRFRHYFQQVEQGIDLEQDERNFFRGVEKELMINVLADDVAVVVTTLVGSGTGIVREWEADHVIVQEAARATNGEVFIAMAHNRDGTMHMSADETQLRPSPQEIADNCFAAFTNRSLFERLITVGYPYAFLDEQYRTIPLLGNIISKVWYNNQVQSIMGHKERPYIALATQVHQAKYSVQCPIVMVDFESTSKRVGAARSKQNEDEAVLSIELAEGYVSAGIRADHIVILTGYMAQVQLLKRMIARNGRLNSVRAATIDSFQGEESPLVIFCIVGHDTLGFMEQDERLLVACSRARDAFAVIGNITGVMVDSKRRVSHAFKQVQALFAKEGAYTKWTQTIEPIPFMAVEHDFDGSTTGQENPTAEQENPGGEQGNVVGALQQAWTQSGDTADSNGAKDDQTSVGNTEWS